MHLLTKCLTLAVLFAAASFGQQCAIGGPSNSAACTKLFTYDGSNNLLYVCAARSIQPTASRISISAASNASTVSLTSASHGFSTSQLPIVTISGGTGNWTAINGTFTATITGANTLTIPVDSTSLGALAGTVVLDTFAPRTTQSIWSVAKMVYSGTNLIGYFLVGGSTSERNTCSTSPTQYQ